MFCSCAPMTAEVCAAVVWDSPSWLAFSTNVVICPDACPNTDVSAPIASCCLMAAFAAIVAPAATAPKAMVAAGVRRLTPFSNFSAALV